MKRNYKRTYLLLAGLALVLGLLFGSVTTTQAATLDYAKTSYATKLSLPVTDHIWRVRIPNLSKATSASVTSSNKKFARATVYNAMLKQGCIYVTPVKTGKSTITVSFTYKNSSGKNVAKTYKIALSVFGYVNPIKRAKIGPRDLASKLENTNYSHSAQLCKGPAMIKVAPKKGWTLKGLYVQGLMKKGSGVVYTTKKIANNAKFNFSTFKYTPEFYIQVYNAKRNMTLLLMLTRS